METTIETKLEMNKLEVHINISLCFQILLFCQLFASCWCRPKVQDALNCDPFNLKIYVCSILQCNNANNTKQSRLFTQIWGSKWKLQCAHWLKFWWRDGLTCMLYHLEHTVTKSDYSTDIIKALHQMYGVKQSFTCPLNPRGNAQCDLFNSKIEFFHKSRLNRWI